MILFVLAVLFGMAAMCCLMIANSTANKRMKARMNVGWKCLLECW